ncbi:hypothetical protein [Luteibacter sahnii]|uniref:hypothetical protein n=1 Tax=Luteibacter sahnii TaxID=3021977 RepID=UPI002A6AF68F|nr:hypothetical protein [Luteibacter sp. PPL193]MDY1547862.1 hypothetical protein [Luteibacter sp. PPL193]
MLRVLEAATLASPSAGAVVTKRWPKVELLFFRELSDDQRLKLFSLHDLPVDEIGLSLDSQKLALRYLLAAAPEVPRG